MRRTPMALGALLLTMAIAACTPVPGRIMTAGDSILWGAQDSTPFLAKADKQNVVGIGWRALHAIPGIDAAVNNPARSPACLALEFGHNETSDLVLDSNEKNAMFAATYAADRATRLVWVMPWRVNQPGAADDPYVVLISQVRRNIATLAASRPNSIAVDWRPVVEAHPNYVYPDGVHLVPGSGANEALSHLIEEGCDV